MKELKRACNNLVQSVFPELKIYGNDTTDGYERPSLFSEILHHGYIHETKNYARSGATYKLTFFERCHDEVCCLEMFEKLKEAFGMTIEVNDRFLLAGEISFEFIGENANMLQISIEFEWTEQKMRIETGEMIEDINLNIYERGGSYGSTKH